MSVESTTCEDLKAFERRLTEVVGFMQPAVVRWRIILLVASICTATGAYFWLTDPELTKITLFRSLAGHWFFVLSALTLIALFACGIHQKVVASSIIVNRLRNVLYDFSLSCDDCGKLILKPRPQNTTH